MDKKFVEEWVVPLTSVEDIHEKFKEFCLGKLRSSPWSELGVLQPKTKIIQQLLGRINTEGFLTINYEPAINGGMSEFLSAGYSEPGGYVYRKANVDFFCSKEKLDALVDKCEALPSLTYIAMNIKGGWISNKGREDVNAVTWGVYPIMGIIEHTVVDLASFILWKDDAFATWSRRWAHLYPEGDSSRKWLEEVQNSYFLVKLVENDYIHGDLFAVFADF